MSLQVRQVCKQITCGQAACRMNEKSALNFWMRNSLVHNVQTGLATHPGCYPMNTEFLSPRPSGWCLQLPTHLHLPLSLRIYGVKTPFPTHVFIMWRLITHGNNLTFNCPLQVSFVTLLLTASFSTLRKTWKFEPLCRSIPCPINCQLAITTYVFVTFCV
jgi:hypothetical protein